jgi:aspartate/methionine/tyrosine aminotransferase
LSGPIRPAIDPTGISQAAGAAVLNAGGYVGDAVAVYQERRDVISEQLAPFGVIPAAGGWSCALDVSPFGLTSGAAVTRLMERGRMAATSLKLSGREYGESLVRLAFGAESATRLARVRGAVEAALS